MARTPARPERVSADTTPLNEVTLRGRLSAPAEARVLPSGDEVVVFRVVVDRPTRPSTGPRSARVDTLDCAAFKAELRRRAGSWEPGDLVEVRGSLRRRFFRAGGGAPASRYEVEAVSLSRVQRSGAGRRATMTA